VPGRLGKGQILHVDKLDHPRTYSYKPEDWYIHPRLWGLPKNHRQVMGELRKLLGGQSVLEVKAPFGCVSGLFRSGRRYVLHLLNYHRDKKLSSIGVQLRLAGPIKSITLMSPEEGTDKAVPFRTANGAVKFRVSELKRYKVFVIET
jgi:hypothetical protein